MRPLRLRGDGWKMRHAPPGVKTASIHIGGIFASREPAVVYTVLGSCISACLFDPLAGVGGINHFMLPSSAEDAGMPTRYGVHAMETLINEIFKLGGERTRLRAKVFGGANVLRMKDTFLTVSERNISFIKEFLTTEEIPLLSHRLGGVNPLQVYFFTDTAKVLVKALPGHVNSGLAEEEGRYRDNLTLEVSHPKDDNVTLF